MVFIWVHMLEKWPKLISIASYFRKPCSYARSLLIIIGSWILRCLSVTRVDKFGVLLIAKSSSGATILCKMCIQTLRFCHESVYCHIPQKRIFISFYKARIIISNMFEGYLQLLLHFWTQRPLLHCPPYLFVKNLAFDINDTCVQAPVSRHSIRLFCVFVD